MALDPDSITVALTCRRKCIYQFPKIGQNSEGLKIGQNSEGLKIGQNSEGLGYALHRIHTSTECC